MLESYLCQTLTSSLSSLCLFGQLTHCVIVLINIINIIVITVLMMGRWLRDAETVSATNWYQTFFLPSIPRWLDAFIHILHFLFDIHCTLYSPSTNFLMVFLRICWFFSTDLHVYQSTSMLMETYNVRTLHKPFPALVVLYSKMVSSVGMNIPLEVNKH